MNFNIKSYKGKEIRINPETRYVCLTDMAEASNKQSSDWTRLKKTNELILALETITGNPRATLLFVGDGNMGTWGHPKLAIQFAQWCNPIFALQVSDWIDELLTTGKVELAPSEKSSLGAMQDFYFKWSDIDVPSVRWKLNKAQKSLKGKVTSVFSKDLDGFCQINIFKFGTMERLITFYADKDDYKSIASMYTLHESRRQLLGNNQS